MSLRSNWLDVVDHAFRWADPKNPFAAHTSLRPYTKRVPKEGIGSQVDRQFWLGEVLDDMRREAKTKLPPADLADFDKYIDSKMADLDLKRKRNPIPILGTKLNPPPKKIRAQRVVAKTVKEQAPAFDSGFIVSTSSDLVRDLGEYLDLANEVYIAIFLNMRNKVVGYTEFTSGSISSVEVHPSGIFQAALLSGAAGMVTVHNHPSGDPTPSNEDRALWRRLRDAGDLMGIPVVDNLVIGDGGRYFSEYEEKAR